MMTESFPSSSLSNIIIGNTNDKSDVPLLPLEVTQPTVNQTWGPFYVQNAPFRAKISPIYAVGTPLIIKGRVFGLDTRQPLPFALIDIWQTSPEAKYDYYTIDPSVKYPYKEINTHGRSTNFDYRSRLVTDEQGRYEYETVKPVPYFYPEYAGWRCPHIHYYVQAQGYKPIITQLYFKDQEKNEIDRHIKESITIELKSIEYERADGSKLIYLHGEFDLVMSADSINKDEQ